MALVLLACALLFIYTADHAAAPTVGLKPEISQDTAYTQEAFKNRRMDLATYLDLHISELSPVQEVLGGKFYVTNVKAANGKGTVTYEDGHMQHIADFNYTESDQEGYTITRFRVRN
jgi:hypothetical protein